MPRIRLGNEREVTTLSDAHELPEPLRVKVESVRRNMTGLKELRAAIDREKDVLATLVSKAVKARMDVFDAFAEVASDFEAYVLTSADRSLLSWNDLHQMAIHAGVDPMTGEVATPRRPSPVEMAMLGPDPKVHG